MIFTKNTKKLLGFTLVEMLVTIAIIAILASIAYPSYTSSIRKGRRTDAKTVLLQASQWMERFYTVNNRYDQTINGDAVDASTQFGASGLLNAPIEGEPKYYDILISNVTRTSYKLIATPINGQDYDECKILTITNTGVKGVEGGATQTADKCWR
jgi:type IV pilus assembly protein PilE